MLPVLHLGPLAIQLPGLILLAGIWFALVLAEKQARINRMEKPDLLSTLFIITILAGIVGARAGFILRYPAAFADNPLSMLSLSFTMLDIPTGLLFGGLAALIFQQRKHLKLLELLDILTPGLAILAIAFSLADLSSGQRFGYPADLPWSIYLWNSWRHPTQLYTLFGSGALLVAYFPKHTTLAPGMRFFSFTVIYAALEILVDAFRADTNLLAFGFHQTQVIAWIIILAAYLILRKTGNNPSEQEEIHEPSIKK